MRDQILSVSTSWSVVFYVPFNCSSTVQGFLPMAGSSTYWKLWEDTPSLGSFSEAQGGGLLSSSSHFYWQQLPGKSWAANVDSSKKFLVKKHTAFLVSTQGNSPPHKACGYIIVFYFFICGEFCPTLKWNSYGFTCVPHPDPPSTSLSTRSL